MKKIIFILFLFPIFLFAQPKEEVRAVWLTTVYGLDWPKAPHSNDQEEMITLLNSLQEANFNTVMFQVRARGDLTYPSAIEPWSKAMTGTLGNDPGWDPLEFVINECHARGMEVHAWFVTYNVYSGQNAPPSTNPEHVVNAHPELCTLYEEGGTYGWWMDPGIPETREYLIDVVMEMINGYELDAIHFDYIRYPGSDFDDAETYEIYGNGQDLGDWRRANINQFVYDVYDEIQNSKPWVKVGSAPIGIHHNIPGATGWQGYYDVYQDARDWAEQEKHDYICPQIYWDLTGRFPYLVDDWIENSFGRPIYTGIAAYLMEGEEEEKLIGKEQAFYIEALKDNTKGWSAEEILNQIDYTREQGGYGQTYFRTLQITYNIKNIHTLLKENQYLYPANIPPMPWKDNIPANKPQNLTITINSPTNITLNWQEPILPSDGDTVKYYNVYQSQLSPIDIDNIANVAVFQIMNQTSATIEFETAPEDNLFFTVTAYDKGYNESEPADEVNLVNFNLISPENNSMNNPNEINLIWETMPDASTYALQVSEEEDFSNLIVDEQNLSATSFLFENMNYNEQYFWKVKPDNIQTWSTIWNFSTSRLEKLWVKNSENNNLPTWFATSGNTERGIAYGNEHLYIVSRSNGLSVNILDASNGNEIGNLNVTGITGGTFELNDVETGTGGAILACNLTSDASTSAFKIYKWNNESSTPYEFINYTTTGTYRLGDNFTILGDLGNDAVIYAAVANDNKIIKWTVTGGVLNTVPVEITLSGITNIGTSPSVAALGISDNADFYVNGNSTMSPTLFANDGTNKGTIPENVIGLSNSALQTFIFQGVRYTSAFQNTDAVNETSGQNAIVMIESKVHNELNFDDRYGVSERIGNNENTYATGDITFKSNGNEQEPIIYVLSTNNGFGAYRFTEIPPVAIDLSISGTAEVYHEITGTYTYQDINEDPEGISLFQWYKADDENGTGRTSIFGAVETTYTLTEEDEGKYIFFEVTPFATSGILKGAESESEASNEIAASTAAAPVASDVYISGIFETGQELTGNYNYFDANGDLEGESNYKWYKADDETGANQMTIIGEVNQTITLTNSNLIGKYIAFRVTPVAETGVIPETLVGEAVLSNYIGPVALDINEINKNRIKIYPNPISEKLYIQNINKIKNISIINVLGQEIKNIDIDNNENNIKINMTEFEKGIYIIKFNGKENNVYIRRIIKIM